MCGFAGLLTRPGPTGDELTAMADRLCDPLWHRGPDDKGAFVDPPAGVCLGFRRLSIFDLTEAGHQPMTSASGRFVLVFNGEIYNHPELRAELEGKGFAFRGRSDTEVFLAAVEEVGIREAVDRFRGMFAFALWDRRDRRLVLGRDRLGIKPLYIFQTPGRMAFASELRSFMALDPGGLSLDPTGVSLFLKRLYVPAPFSIFREVRKVLPGTLVEVEMDGREMTTSQHTYWSLEQVARDGVGRPFQGSWEEAVEALDGVLRESVAIRLRADVAVGAFLSGGVDSSLVVALAQEVASHPVRTFTVSFDSRAFNEGGHAADVAGHLGTDHTDVPVSQDDLISVVPELPLLFDEPLADPSQLPTYLVSRVAREAVTVSLSGDGGDELFGGYNRYITGGGLLKNMDRLPGTLRRLSAGVLGNPLLARGLGVAGRSLAGGAGFTGQHPLEARVEKLRRVLGTSGPAAGYLSLLEVGNLDPDICSLPEGGGEREPSPRFQDSLSLLQNMLLFDQTEYLPDDLLAKVDRASMAVSLEARVPVLDHRVVEESWTFPDTMKVDDGGGKRILKELLYRRVPRELVDRPKMGFSVPLSDWLHGPVREWAQDVLDPEGVSRVGVLDPEAVSRCWRAFQEGRDKNPLAIWTLLMLQSWCLRWGVGA